MAPKCDFSWSPLDEPHALRRKEILEKHPEIRSLFYPEPRTGLIVLGLCVIQFCMAYWMQNQPWYILVFAAYVIGGTINHSLQLAVHELSHNLGYKSLTANRLMAMIANLPTGFPSSVAFQRYHMDHHTFQGVDGIDTDIPTLFEGNYFTNCVLKFMWVFGQPICYGLRPMIVQPKPPNKWEGLNWILGIMSNILVYTMLGGRALLYLVLGTYIGLGLHPAAGHFIAEHYEFVSGQETYSYYGPLNYVNFNVGYHVEHHDFPRIPWSRLPALKRMAPEYYDHLPSYQSYLYIFWRFITDENIGCFSRIKRKPATVVAKRGSSASAKPSGVSKLYTKVCIGFMLSGVGYCIYGLAKC